MDRILNIVIFCITLFCTMRFFRKDGTWAVGNGAAAFRFFTVQSNVFCAVAALLMFLAPSSTLVWTLKYVGTAAVTVTMLTVFVFLGPNLGYKKLLTGAEKPPGFLDSVTGCVAGAALRYLVPVQGCLCTRGKALGRFLRLQQRREMAAFLCGHAVGKPRRQHGIHASAKQGIKKKRAEAPSRCCSSLFFTRCVRHQAKPFGLFQGGCRLLWALRRAPAFPRSRRPPHLP